MVPLTVQHCVRSVYRDMCCDFTVSCPVYFAVQCQNPAKMQTVSSVAPKRLLENALTELDKVAQLFSSSRQAAADFSSSSSSSRAKAGSQILNPAKDTSTNRSVTLAAEQRRLFGYRPSSFYSHRNRGQSRNRQLSWSTSRHDRRLSKNAYTITAILPCGLPTENSFISRREIRLDCRWLGIAASRSGC